MLSRNLPTLILILGVSACDGADPEPEAQEPDPRIRVQQSEDPAEDFATAMGAGSGGGTLMFDGTSYPIESALCYLDEPLDVGTVGAGFRIVISGSVDRPSVSIVQNSLQWVPDRYPNNAVEVSGSHLSYSADTYRNNRDDRKVEASFEIDCPPA